ncbi:MAG TPA: hypothetical protein VGY58_13080, partial [Gemmataceae bacterium]|nr:hypothetical protein [Gemmataceae bacterium]
SDEMRTFVTRRRLLFLISALLVARIAWVTWEASFRNNVDAVSARYDQVLVGMDRNEVQRIMGMYKVGQTVTLNPDGTKRPLAVVWATAKGALWILYGADGKVVKKWVDRPGFIHWLRSRFPFPFPF